MKSTETLKARDLRAEYEVRASILKALAHPTRLFFVEVLSKGERCVCELAAMVDADLSTDSKHLSMLRLSGLLDQERRGAQIFYRLRTPCVLGFLSCVSAVRRAAARPETRLRPRARRPSPAGGSRAARRPGV